MMCSPCCYRVEGDVVNVEDADGDSWHGEDGENSAPGLVGSAK